MQDKRLRKRLSTFPIDNFIQRKDLFTMPVVDRRSFGGRFSVRIQHFYADNPYRAPDKGAIRLSFQHTEKGETEGEAV